MKTTKYLIAIISLGIAITTYGSAQEGTELRMQGIDYITHHSVASRASGATIFSSNGSSLMFHNPAALTQLTSLQVSTAASFVSFRQKQMQDFGTLQTHANAVFLLQGITDQIPDPDYSTIRRRVTQEDSVQRPFDNLKPYWDYTKETNLPLQLFVASPLKIGSVDMAIGVGAVEYANLNWFYQNNNTLSPNILDVTKGTIRIQNLPRTDTIATTTQPMPVYWSQYRQYRDGSIYGYGGAIAVKISQQLSLGIAGMILDGSTTDEEVQVGRGRMLFFSHSIRLDKYGMTTWIKKGKSTYSGYELLLSGTYETRYVTFGFSLRLPTTITRRFSYSYSRDSVTATAYNNAKIDSVHDISNSTISGEDKIELPLRGVVGIRLNITESIKLGVEYEIQPYATASYVINGVKSHPWLSYSALHVGGEYFATKWLVFRAGVREACEEFQPATSALRGENVRYPVYSIGTGVSLFGATLNVAYEYSDRRYTDVWSNSASKNRKFTHAVYGELTYQLPFMSR